MGGELEKRNETKLERLESWADLSRGERRRRAGVAVRDGDTDALADLLAAYLRTEGKAGMRVSDHTLDTYGRGMRKLLTWCDSNGMKPHNLTRIHATRFRAWLQDNLSDKTVNIYLTAARRFLSALQWAGLNIGDKNPFEGITVREATNPKEKADPYSVEELNALLSEANTRDRAIILLAADGGLRLSEIADLQWGAVDLSRRQLTVTGKGRKLRRPKITRRLRDALKALPEPHTGDVIGVGRERIQQLWRDLCKRAGVNPRGIHNARHTCGTRLYEKTRDLQAVARHLGHSTTKTSELYAHLGDNDYAAAVDALDGNGVD